MQVSACAERLVARACQHDGTQASVGVGLAECFGKPCHDGRVDGVAAALALDGQAQNAIAFNGLEFTTGI